MKKLLLFVVFVFTLLNAKEITLYERLGGYQQISNILTDFHIRLKNDKQLGRFWRYRGTDGKERELQLLIDFVCASTGGPVHYSGRDMFTTHKGMQISQSDWKIFIKYLKVSLKKYNIKKTETKEVLSFIDNLKSTMVEVK